MFEDTYKTIAKESEGIFKDRGSRFIALAFRVNTPDDVKSILEDIKNKYHDARHHCYAWRTGHDKSAFRTNDDGEPSGTAGRPIFGQIQSFDLTDLIVVVVRYFGGTKLGVSGLINAYKTAAAEALKNAEIIELTVNDVYEVSFEYSLMNDVMSVVKEMNLTVLNTDFKMDCRLQFSIRKNESNLVYERFLKLSQTRIKYLRTY